jgi:hypothetical protein
MRRPPHPVSKHPRAKRSEPEVWVRFLKRPATRQRS